MGSERVKGGTSERVKGGTSERGVWGPYVTFLLTHDLEIRPLPFCMLFSMAEMPHRDMVCLVVHDWAALKGHFGYINTGKVGSFFLNTGEV